MENCLREDLKPIEQAKAFKALLQRRGYSYRQLAESLHISHQAIVRALALLDLPEDLQGRVEAGELAPSVAYEVSRLKGSDQQREVATRVVEEELNRAEATEVVRRAAGKSAKPKGRGAGKARKVTFRTSPGPKITVEFRKGLDDELILARAGRCDGSDQRHAPRRGPDRGLMAPLARRARGLTLRSKRPSPSAQASVSARHTTCSTGPCPGGS